MNYRYNGKVILVLIWTVFTSSLAAWWLIFGLRQLNRAHEFTAQELQRHQKMLIWEGGILIILLLVGGGAILYFLFQLVKANQGLKRFFATFSHELRTSISSLRLQAESMRDEWSGPKIPQLDRLVRDSVRLQLQLENSLNLAQMEKSQMFLQELSIKKLLGSIHHQWPDLTIQVKGNDKVVGDERALNSILTNLIQNAASHGEATEVTIDFFDNSGSLRRMVVRDNGLGFQGDYSKLSTLFARHGHKSGSGVGLYLVKSLVKKMNGSVRFVESAQQGFEVEIQLPFGEQK